MFEHFKQIAKRCIFVRLPRFAVAFTVKMKELAAAEWVCLCDGANAYSISSSASS